MINVTNKTDKIDIYHQTSGKIVETIPTTPLDQLPSILTQAKIAQIKWAQLSFKTRAKFLKQIVQTLKNDSKYYATQISYYNGKLKEEALVAEIFPTLSGFEYFSGHVRNTLQPENLFLKSIPFAKSTLLYEPLGVVGMITPWNYPFMLALQDVPAALMAGNAVIIKPSEYAAKIGHLIEKLLRDSHLPPHLVQCIYGYGDLGASLIESGIQKICFIGSTKVGQLVYQQAAKMLIPCTLELGGKDAAIILEDADQEKAVKGITWAAFTNCGQTCASVELAYLPLKQKEQYLEAFKKYFDELPDHHFGSMNTLQQRSLVEEQLQEASSQGAVILAQKNLKENQPHNPFIINPTILSNISPKSKILRDETFGPLLPLIFYEDLNQVINEVNNHQYGLTTSIWTRDYKRGVELAKKIDSGVITINDHMITPGLPESPWTGHKKSGLGFSHSYLSLKSFSKIKYLYHDRGLIRFKFWQYPFSQEKWNWILQFQESQYASSPLKRAFYLLKVFPKLLFHSSPSFKRSSREDKC